MLVYQRVTAETQPKPPKRSGYDDFPEGVIFVLRFQWLILHGFCSTFPRLPHGKVGEKSAPPVPPKKGFPKLILYTPRKKGTKICIPVSFPIHQIPYN